MDRRWLPAGALGLAAVVAGVWWGRGLAAPPVPPPPAAQTAASSTAAPSLVVHVSGWVNQPGLVTVPTGRGWATCWRQPGACVRGRRSTA